MPKADGVDYSTEIIKTYAYDIRPLRTFIVTFIELLVIASIMMYLWEVHGIYFWLPVEAHMYLFGIIFLLIPFLTGLFSGLNTRENIISSITLSLVYYFGNGLIFSIILFNNPTYGFQVFPMLRVLYSEEDLLNYRVELVFQYAFVYFLGLIVWLITFHVLIMGFQIFGGVVRWALKSFWTSDYY